MNSGEVFVPVAYFLVSLGLIWMRPPSVMQLVPVVREGGRKLGSRDRLERWWSGVRRRFLWGHDGSVVLVSLVRMVWGERVWVALSARARALQPF
jgi:hypothetical protein